jgi:hypothetical protein
MLPLPPQMKNHGRVFLRSSYSRGWLESAALRGVWGGPRGLVLLLLFCRGRQGTTFPRATSSEHMEQNAPAFCVLR